MTSGLGVWQRLTRRLHRYHCKGCGEWFGRRLPNCPVCKVRKGGRGRGGMVTMGPFM
jgi:hypothetical protein